MTRSLSTLMTGTLLLSMVFSGSSMAQVDLRQRPTHPIGGAKEKMETQVDLQKKLPGLGAGKTATFAIKQFAHDIYQPETHSSTDEEYGSTRTFGHSGSNNLMGQRNLPKILGG